MRAAWAAALWALCAAPAAALDATDIPGVAGTRVETDEDRLARDMSERLRSDPGTADALALRILESSLGPQLSESGDPARALSDIRDWIRKNPDSAGHLASGFAQDDARGDHAFERSLFSRIERYFELNPGRNRGILGKLDRIASESKSLAAVKDLDDEERREMLKKFFEGKAEGAGSLGARNGGPSGGRPPADAAAAYAGEGLYDRLNSANPTGYSPQVLAIQSEMNIRRAPGAPKLAETGRLDYATLRHPYYGMRSDINSLDKSLRRDGAAEAAGLLGERRSARELDDPAVQRTLEAGLKAGGKSPGPELARRAEALSNAERALAAFDAEAAKAKSPRGISRERLEALSAKRREVARFISLAAQQERLRRLKSWRGFLTSELRESVAKAPAPEELRERYLGRGRSLEREIETAVSAAERSLVLLSGGADAKTLAEAQTLVEATGRAIKALPPELSLYAATPDRLLASRRGISRLDSWLEEFALRFFPGSARSRAVREARKKEDDARAAFARVANR